jgi:2-amino-4-hydroxy-6-hydroxymethyldihydropteridine diphosphokinase
MKKETVYLGLGSNLGDRVAHLREAVQRVHAFVEIEKVSQLYVAAPLGYVRDDAFVNAALVGKTTLRPPELLDAIEDIEQIMGRKIGVQFGPRHIDLDILLYGNLELETPRLKIPHARMHQRAFVLKPLADLNPKLMHPTLFYTIAQLLQDAEDANQVQLYQP